LQRRTRISLCCRMRKISKVVPITQADHQLIAADETSHRLIVAIGNRRIALDFFTRITELSPATGSSPATVLAMKKDSRSKPT